MRVQRIFLCMLIFLVRGCARSALWVRRKSRPNFALLPLCKKQRSVGRDWGNVSGKNKVGPTNEAAVYICYNMVYSGLYECNEYNPL